MFCPQCGNELPNGAKFCPKCGRSVSGQSQYSEDQKRFLTLQYIGQGIWALLGVVSLLTAIMADIYYDSQVGQFLKLSAL